MGLKGMIDRKLVMLVVAPLLRRVGTMIAAYLVAKGAPADTVDQWLTWFLAGGGVTFDLLLAFFERKGWQKKVAVAELQRDALAWSAATPSFGGSNGNL